MADEKEKKTPARKPKAEGGDEKPKRTRSTASRKASTDEKPARAKAPAKAKAKSDESAAKPKRPATRRRAPTAKKDDAAPKADAKQPEAETKAKPKQPARRTRSAPKREAARPAPAAPVVTAQAKYVRSSARKARLVLDHVRGKPVGEARALLRHSPRGVARDLERLLASAIANAENNHDLVGEDLYVKEIYADEGPTLKRFRARAQGRAFRIRKRTSHLTVALTPKE
jgi:ribosomal protein L22